MYLDLQELEEDAAKIPLSSRAWAPLSFLPRDHIATEKPLSQAVRDLVEEKTAWRPQGPIRLLTLPRCWGYYFNPLSLYYCFDSIGQQVEAVMAEVNNTPWNERHYYVLWQGNRTSSQSLHFGHRKDFHVSPFMDMEYEYLWKLTPPGAGLGVQLENHRDGQRHFDATLTLRSRPLTRGALRRLLFRHPFLSGLTTAAIYYQALRLWWKKCPFYPHPRSSKLRKPPTAG